MSISKALADVQRSYSHAKASVASRHQTQLMTSGEVSPAIAKQPEFQHASEQYAYNKDWVHSCVHLISNSAAGQPIRVGRDVRGKPVALESHQLLDLLADPNELMTTASLIYSTVASLELTGRALWHVDINKRTIIPVPIDWITSIAGSNRFETFYVKPPGKTEAIPLPSEEVVYIHYPDPSNPRGASSPLQKVARAVMADESLQTSQAATFANGINPSLALFVGRNVGPDGKPQDSRPTLTSSQRRSLITGVKKVYSGVAKHGEPLILDGLLERVEKLSMKPEEMAWLDSAQSLKSRIVEGFGVNPILLGEVEGANRASATQAEVHFAKFTLNPKLRLISDSLTEWLGKRFGVKIWLEPMQVADKDLELQQLDLMCKYSCVEVNEVRAAFGYPEMPDGDVLVMAADNIATAVAQLARV